MCLFLLSVSSSNRRASAIACHIVKELIFASDPELAAADPKPALLAMASPTAMVVSDSGSGMCNTSKTPGALTRTAPLICQSDLSYFNKSSSGSTLAVNWSLALLPAEYTYILVGRSLSSSHVVIGSGYTKHVFASAFSSGHPAASTPSVD